MRSLAAVLLLAIPAVAGGPDGGELTPLQRCLGGPGVSDEDMDWDQSCDAARLDSKEWRATIVGILKCFHVHKRDRALAEIKDEKEASKIAGVTNNANLYRLQKTAYEAGKVVKELEEGRKRLKLKDLTCGPSWTSWWGQHLGSCLEAIDVAQDGTVLDGPECGTEPVRAALRLQATNFWVKQ